MRALVGASTTDRPAVLAVAARVDDGDVAHAENKAPTISVAKGRRIGCWGSSLGGECGDHSVDIFCAPNTAYLVLRTVYFVPCTSYTVLLGIPWYWGDASAHPRTPAPAH